MPKQHSPYSEKGAETWFTVTIFRTVLGFRCEEFRLCILLFGFCFPEIGLGFSLFLAWYAVTNKDQVDFEPANVGLVGC